MSNSTPESHQPFDAEGVSIGDFLAKTGTGIYIPLYQRRYRWTKANAERLFTTISDGISRWRPNGCSSTFLGTVITVADPNIFPPAKDRPSQVLQVIDGQQRIATLLCMFGELGHAARSAIAQLPQSAKADFPITCVNPILESLRHTLSFAVLSSDTNELPRMIRGGVDQWGKVSGKYESEIGRYLATVIAGNDCESTGSALFDEARSAIRKSLSKALLRDLQTPIVRWRLLVDSMLPTGDGIMWPVDVDTRTEYASVLRLLAYASYATKCVHVIHVHSSTEESASSIFESLNTTGELLTAFETFVPLVVALTGGQAEYSGSEEEKEIQRFQRFVANAPSRSKGTRSRKAIVAFALSDAGQKVGEQLHDQRVYLRSYEGLSAEERQTFIRGLTRTAEFLDDVWYREGALAANGDEAQVALSMLIGSGHTICQGLLIRGYEEFRNGLGARFVELVTVIAGFWVLWRLSHSNTANVDNYHRRLMRGTPGGLGPYSRRPPDGGDSTVPDPERVAADLRSILEANGQLCDRDDWVARVCELAHGASSNKTVLRYALLGAYHDAMPDEKEYLMHGADRSVTTLSRDWWKEELTVEHIAPQTRGRDDASYSDGVYMDRKLHRLGNLTLLPQRENVIIGRKSWKEKRKYFNLYCERRSDERLSKLEAFDLRPQTRKLLSTRFVPFCADVALVKDDCWTEDHVAHRGAALAGLIWDRFAPYVGIGKR